MTIAALIETLEAFKKQYGPEKIVYLSKDPEGNEIHAIDEIAEYEDDAADPLIVIWPTDEAYEFEDDD